MLKRRFGSIKPTPGSVLKSGHPLASGMLEAWAFREGGGGITIDAASGRVGTLATGLKWAPMGILWPTSPGVSDFITVNPAFTSQFADSGNLMTIIAGGFFPDVANRQTIYGNSNATGAAQLEIGSSAGEVSAIISGTYIFRSSGSVIQANAYTTLAICRRGSGATNQAYVNGLPTGIVVNASNSYANPSATHIIGARASGSQNLRGTTLYFVYAWNRPLSISELQWVHAEPYAMFERSVSRRLFAGAAAGGGFQSAWARNSNVVLGPGMRVG